MSDERLEIALETLELYATGQEIDTLGPHDAKALLRHIEAQREVVEAAREYVNLLDDWHAFLRDEIDQEAANITEKRINDAHDRLREALDKGEDDGE